jgi:hypothetical protein
MRSDDQCQRNGIEGNLKTALRMLRAAPVVPSCAPGEMKVVMRWW